MEPNIPIPCYTISADPRGLCIIINNKNFFDSRKLKTRSGTEVDGDKLTKIFVKLGFQVKTHDDLTSDGIIDVVKEVAGTDHSNYDCVAFCILSHGQDRCVHGTDGNPIEITTITDHFIGVNCRTLKGKPKLFFIQACQGSTMDQGFESDSMKSTIANGADFLVGYSTVPRYVSWRHTEEGSWYISTLVQMLDKYCNSLDILHIMTLVTRDVAERKTLTGSKQCPKIDSTLRMPLYIKEIQSDKQLHRSLMHELSAMLTKTDLEKLKNIVNIEDQMAPTADSFRFLALLERHDFISVGQYDVLIEHLRKLKLDQCIRVIKEHAAKMGEYRQAQVRYVAPLSAKVNQFDKDGKTQLMLAVYANDVARVRCLIEEGADLNLKGWRYGKTALDWAKKRGHSEIVKMLKSAPTRR